MSRQEAPVQINQFIGGFVTESNPLNFPLNASVDELNLKLNKDGSRERRPGFDVEVAGTSFEGSSPSGARIGRNMFTWDSPGGFFQEQFVIVQAGSLVNFHRVIDKVVSNDPFYSVDLEVDDVNYGMTTFDSSLVIVTGGEEVYVYTYDGTDIKTSQLRLTVRDFFGVYDGLGDQDRPATLSSEHLYNLRNQTFAIPRTVYNNDDKVEDPIYSFYRASKDDEDDSNNTWFDSSKLNSFLTELGVDVAVQVTSGKGYPSSADDVNTYLYANANHSSDRTVERYNADDAFDNTPYTTAAAKGHFIIDVLNRGSSRLIQEENLRQRNPSLAYEVESLPADQTNGGATIVREYAGRVWYAGFGAEVYDGDANSPSLSRYVLFSQVSDKIESMGKCYQVADPTSHTDPDLVDTDGGFIKLSDANQIIGMEVAGKSLFIFADNGVWRIVGLDENSFSATNYSVEFITSYGCVSGTSIITTGQQIFYWSETGIFALVPDEVSGSWKAQDLTDSTIKSYLDNYSLAEKSNIFSFYNKFESTVSWSFSNQLLEKDYMETLIFSLRYGAFTKFRVEMPPDGSIIGIAGISGVYGLTDPLLSTVTVEGETVTVDGEEVTIRSQYTGKGEQEEVYLMFLEPSGENLEYTFGKYIENSTVDWESQYGEGITTEAYLIAGITTGGDARLTKNVPYITTYLENYGEYGSSCKLSCGWDLGMNYDSDYGWSPKREAYRYNLRQQYYNPISTRNAIRGSGQSLLVRFQSSGDLPLKIYGWDYNLQSNTRQ